MRKLLVLSLCTLCTLVCAGADCAYTNANAPLAAYPPCNSMVEFCGPAYAVPVVVPVVTSAARFGAARCDSTFDPGCSSGIVPIGCDPRFDPSCFSGR